MRHQKDMRSLTRLCALLLSLTIASQAQSNINWRGFGDTAAIGTFRADSLKFTKAFNASNGEQKTVIVAAEDTSSAGRGSDSIRFAYGYQVGTPMYTIGGVYDTMWSNGIVIDTFNNLIAGNRYNPNALTGAGKWLVDTLTDLPITAYRQIDTVSSASSSLQWRAIVPPWAPLIRFYFRGLTGNKIGRHIVLRCYLMQRKYIPVGN